MINRTKKGHSRNRTAVSTGEKRSGNRQQVGGPWNVSVVITDVEKLGTIML